MKSRNVMADQQPGSSAISPRSKEQIIRAVLRGLARRWKAAVGFGLLAAIVVGAAVWMFLPPPVPTASVKLFIPAKPPTVVSQEHPDPPLDRQTQVELIKSRFILNAAIRPPEVNNLSILHAQDDPLEWLASKLKVEFIGPEILRISLSNEDAEQARVIVDAVKDSYLEHIIERASADRSRRLKRLKEMANDQE